MALTARAAQRTLIWVNISYTDDFGLMRVIGY